MFLAKPTFTVSLRFRPQSSDNSLHSLSIWSWPYGSMATGPYGPGLWVAPLALGHRPKSKAAAMAMLWLLPWSCSLLWLGGCVRARCTSVANEIVVCLIVLELGS